jgi:hypothetical protein
MKLLKPDMHPILPKDLCLRHIGLTKLNGKYMSQINIPLRGEEKEQFKKLIKTQPVSRLLNPKEKIGDKIPKDFNPRKG